MNRIPILSRWPGLLLLLAGLGASTPALADAWDELVAAERAFAADAQTRSVKEAFLAVLADDAVLFDPEPVPGRALWQSRSDDFGSLQWFPEAAEVSVGGDVGYTYGAWRYAPPAAAAADEPAEEEATESESEAGAEDDAAVGPTFVAFGHYLSVWRRSPDGAWKLVLDHGIVHGEQPLATETRRRGSISLGGGDVSAPVPELYELRRADLLPAGLTSAEVLAPDAVLMRNNHLPGQDLATPALAAGATPRVAAGAWVAPAGDLAFTWGGSQDGPSWLRVWRRPTSSDPPGLGWRLAVDLARPRQVRE